MSTENQNLLDSLLKKKTLPLDLSPLGVAFQGQTYDVWVNPPRIIETIEGEDDYTAKRKVVAILFEWELAKVQQLDDAIMIWLYRQGMDLYGQHLLEIQKKTPAD